MIINTVCVCGAGTMGSGIAQVTAAAGYMTVLYDLNKEVLQKARTKLQASLNQLVEKGKLTGEQRDRTWQHLVFTADPNLCIADLLIEAVVEEKEVKTALFRQLAQINSADAILATNTSSLSITQLAQSIPGPERLAGLHFFNPAPVMKLVEVVKGEETKKEVVAALVHLATTLGKTPVVCADSPGFIVNRVARPFYIEALRLAERGIASFETIDRLLQARGFKMGPFALMDLIGNDVNYAVSCSVYEQLQRPERLKPSAIQKEKVAQGALGKKSGSGYYTYGSKAEM